VTLCLPQPLCSQFAVYTSILRYTLSRIPRGIHDQDDPHLFAFLCRIFPFGRFHGAKQWRSGTKSRELKLDNRKILKESRVGYLCRMGGLQTFQ
jgi:hypothetical protein